MSKSQSKKMKLLVASLAVGSLYFMPVSQAANAGEPVQWKDNYGMIQSDSGKVSLLNSKNEGIIVNTNPATMIDSAIQFRVNGIDKGMPALLISKEGATFYTGVKATSLTADTLTLGTTPLTENKLTKLNALAESTFAADFTKYEKAGIVPGTVEPDTDKAGNVKNEGSIALGLGSHAGKNGINTAIGKDANVWGANSVAIGANARNGKKMSVALGNNSTVANNYEVSVGKAGEDGFTRKITNVTAGEADTDAVNVAQLNKQLEEYDKYDVHWDHTETGKKIYSIAGDGVRLNLDKFNPQVITNDKSSLIMTDSAIGMTNGSHSIIVNDDGVNVNGNTKVNGSLNVLNGNSNLAVSDGITGMTNGNAAVTLMGGTQANVTVGNKGFTVDASGTRVAGGFSVEGSKIANVAEGTADTDAVNVAQLNKQIKESDKYDVQWNHTKKGEKIYSITGDGSTLYLDKDGDTGITNDTSSLTMMGSTIGMTNGQNAIVVNDDGVDVNGNTKVNGSLNVLNGNSNLAVSDAVTGMTNGNAAVTLMGGTQANVTVGNKGFTVDASGTRVAGGFSVEGSKIANVAEGTADTDAVNVAQLNKQIKESDKYDVQWNHTKKGEKIYSITGDGSTLYLDKDGDTGITNDTSSLTMMGSTIGMTNGQNAIVVNDDGVDVNGNTKVNGSLNVLNGNSNLAVSDAVTGMTNGNAAVTLIGGTQANVTVGNKGFTVDTNGTRVTGGFSVEGSKIANVGAGTADTDAVNFSQLKSAQKASTTEVKGDNKNITVDKTAAEDGHQIYTVKLDDDIDVKNVNAETADIGGVKLQAGQVYAANDYSSAWMDGTGFHSHQGDLYSDITPGKVAVGNGTQRVEIDGTSGTISGLSNTKFDLNAMKGSDKAATEAQVEQAYSKAVEDAGTAAGTVVKEALGDQNYTKVEGTELKDGMNVTDAIGTVNNKVDAVDNKVGDLKYSNADSILGSDGKPDTVVKDGDSVTTAIGKLDNKIDDKINNVAGDVNGVKGRVTAVENKTSDITNDGKGNTTIGGNTVINNNGITMNGTADVATANGSKLSTLGDTAKLDSELTKNDKYTSNQTVVGAVNAEADIRRSEVARLDSSVSALGSRVDSLESRMGDVEERIDKVGAMSAAIANLRTMGYDPEAPTEIAVGVGQYKSETGLALGVFHYPNQDFMLSASVSTSGDEVMGGIGATWKLGRKSAAERERISEEKAAAKAAEIKAAAEKAAKDAEVNAQREKHAKLLAQREAAHQDIHQFEVKD